MRKKIFDDGLTLIHTYKKKTLLAGIAITVCVGSKNENLENNGISHVLEHMLFKGTNTRSANDISVEFDLLGSLNNASTSKTRTMFYSLSPQENLEKCSDILADMLFSSKIDEKELELEKTVILSEQAMYEDDYSNLASENLDTILSPGRGISMPIIGTRENIKKFTRDDLINHLKKYYRSDNIIIHIIGNCSFERAIKLVDEKFADKFKKLDEKLKESKIKRENTGLTSVVNKDIKQSYTSIGYPIYKGKSSLKDITLYKIANYILGHGTSSRLYTSIREKNGLVYDVRSTVINLSNKINNSEFYLNVEFATDTEKWNKANALVDKCIDEFKLAHITDIEFNYAIAQLRVSLMLKSESFLDQFMSNIYKYILFGKDISIKKEIQMIDSLTKDDLIDFIKSDKFQPKNKYLSFVGEKIKMEGING